MYNQESRLLENVIQNYFDGIYHGDKLKKVFYPNSVLHGDINGETYLKSFDDYLTGVQNRQSPSELGETNQMTIISIEILNTIAYAKLHVPMYQFNYYDYLAFSKIEGEWLVVNKSFTHVSV